MVDTTEWLLQMDIRTVCELTQTVPSEVTAPAGNILTIGGTIDLFVNDYFFQ